jgi:hypothetical protein
MGTDKYEKSLRKMTKLPLNPYRHFYLYAKGHYKKSDNLIADMRALMKDYTGNSLSDNQVVEGVITILREEIIQHMSSYDFSNLLIRICDSWRYPDPPKDFISTKELYPLIGTRIIYEYLCILVRVPVVDENQAFMNLGEADPTILPTKKMGG